MNTAAVIVTYNSARVIARCLNSCRLAGLLEVVVIDNASCDSTLDEIRAHPWVRLIANPENRGFAAAVNQGFQATRAPFVLLLNPDAAIGGGIQALESACAPHDVAAACGRLLDPHGRLQAGFAIRRFPTPWALVFEVLGINRMWPGNTVNRTYRYADFRSELTQSVPQPAGAFLLVKRSVWNDTGGFDERFYPLWFEDVDFCYRVFQNGWRIVYQPTAFAIHDGAHSLELVPPGDREQFWYGSLLKYAGKHHSRIGVRLVAFAVALGSALRALGSVFRVSKHKPLAVYGKVIRLACHYLLRGNAGRLGSCTNTRSMNQAQMHVL